MRSPRTVASCLVCLLVVLAGCQVPFSDGGDERPGRLEVPERYPPGVSESGVDDPRELVFNHTDRLYRTSYTVDRRTEIRDENGTLRSSSERTVWREADGTFYAVLTVEAGPAMRGNVDVTRIEEWGNGSVGVASLESRNSTRYVEGSRRTFDRTYSDRLLYLFSQFDTTHAGNDTLDGHRVHVVTANASTAPDRVGAFSFGNVSNVSFTAWIDLQGLVRAWHLEYEAEMDGETVRVEQTVRIGGVDSTTVSRPDWVEVALNRTGTPDRE